MELKVPTYIFAQKIVEKNTTLDEVYQQADNYCKTCRTPSPMICVEECELWKVKNEFLQLNGFVGEKTHIHMLLNAIKNNRRSAILNLLAQRSQNKREIQKQLKMHKYLHSCSTIEEYMKLLLQTGLVREENGIYTLTIYGRKIQDALKKLGASDSLPTHSRCYEEMVLKTLIDGPKTQDELLTFLPKRSFSRIMRRLRERGLIARIKRSSYVSYFKTKRGTRRKLSPTERRVFNAIPPSGISPQNLSKDVKITLRRTYKYLRKLGDKDLVHRQPIPLAFELTSEGNRSACFLEDITKLATSTSKALNIMLQQHPNMATASSKVLS